MSGALFIRNRQNTVRVNPRQLRRITLALLGELLRPDDTFDLGLYLVGAAEITRLNEAFLRHAGSTDVIAFNYSDHAPRVTHHGSPMHGEVFICLDEAQAQARRFRTTWQSELARYVIHGILHLAGHDDRRAADRRKMKREENRLLARLARSFKLSELAARNRK